MLKVEDAELIVTEEMPLGTIVRSVILHGDEYLFIAVRPDPAEGMFDPFVKVNASTGAFSDYSPQEYDNPREIIEALDAQAKPIL